MDLSSLLCHLFSFLISILLLEIPTLASGKFSVIGPTGPIQVSVGEVAELPCHLSPTQSAEHMEVVWFQSTRLVHLYRDGEDQLRDQDQDYKERTELVKDSLASGNITLRIRDARLLDEGNYKCHFEDGFHLEEADMILRVSGEEAKPVLVSWMITFIVYITVFWVLTLSFFIWFILRYQENLTQTSPWLWKINGILVVTWSYEIGIAMYFLWILLRCQGFSHTEESDKLDWMDWVAFLISLFLPWRMAVTLLTLFKGRCCCQIKGCCELSERNPRTSPNTKGPHGQPWKMVSDPEETEKSLPMCSLDTMAGSQQNNSEILPTPTSLTNMTEKENEKCKRGCGKIGILRPSCGAVNWSNHSGEQFGTIPKKYKTWHIL